MRERRTLHELQQFVLNRKAADIRCELYAHMIVHAIYDHGGADEALSYSVLSSEIGKDYQLSEIPQIHLDEALENLVADKHVIRNGNLLLLSKTKRNEIKINLDKSSSLEKNITDNLKQRLREGMSTLSQSQINHIVENFYILLGATFVNYGSEVASIFVDESKGVKELKKYPDFQEIYQQKILKTIPKSMHSELDKVFNEFFFNPSEELSEFFFTMSQSYVYLQILNLDPDLKNFQKMSWSKKKIYLDTNVLMALLFEENALHETVETLINQTRQLGAQLFVSERTQEEFLRVLQACKTKNRNFKLKSKFAEALHEAKNDNQFLTTYAVELRKNPNLSMNVFCKKYEEFDKLIETNYSIKIEPFVKEIQEQVKEDIDRLGVHIVTRAMWKNDDVMSHDLYNILRVRDLRKKSPSDEIGPTAWLLTTDHTLTGAEYDTYTRKIIPSSVRMEIWLQIISPFISPSITMKDKSIAFTRLLSSKFTSHKISVNELTNLMTVFMDDSKLTVEQIRMIIGNDFIKEKLHDVQELIDKGEEITLEQFQPIMNKGLEIIEEDYKKKLESKEHTHESELHAMKESIDELHSKLDALTTDKKELESKSTIIEKNSKARIIIIILSAITDVAVTYLLQSVPTFPIYGIIISIMALFGVEAMLIYMLPKFIKYANDRKIKQSEPWSRSDKIAIASMIFSALALPTAILIALYLK